MIAWGSGFPVYTAPRIARATKHARDSTKGDEPTTSTKEAVINMEKANAVVKETAASRVRILLVEDHALMREALKALLETDPGLEIVGEAATFAEGLEAVGARPPDVILLDLRLPDQSGLEVYEQIRQIDARIPVIFVTLAKTAAVAQAPSRSTNSSPNSTTALCCAQSAISAATTWRPCGRLMRRSTTPARPS